MYSQESVLNLNIQNRIDAINWYHEFDFGNGLVAKSKQPDIEFHRRLWAFIQSKLDPIDFAGKTVLDIGCWDGYWSFYAEKRGATHVMATDDAEQNWASDNGLMLAKELLRSSIETNTNLSIYDLADAKKRFDIVLCLGVYYHLIDPFYALSQIRHCCHDNTIVVLEGDVLGGPEETAIYNFKDSGRARFQPSQALLARFLEATYFNIVSHAFLNPLNFRSRVRRALRPSGWKPPLNRIVLVCRPFKGRNECYWYPPPFGLDCYDTRWK